MSHDTFRGVNKIYKVFEKDTAHGSHVLTGDMVRRMTVIEGRYPVSKLPMCAHCESAGLWTKNQKGDMVGWCEKCGTTTVHPITYSEYLTQGHHLPDYVKNSDVGRDVLKLMKAYDDIYGLDKELR